MHGLFLTQSSKEDQDKDQLMENEDENLFFGLPVDDFQSSCSSILSVGTHYSDISDDESVWENSGNITNNG